MTDTAERIRSFNARRGRVSPQRDDTFQRLLTFPNVLVTGHQAFFTREAMAAIVDTTLANITAFEQGEMLANAVGAELVRASFQSPVLR